MLAMASLRWSRSKAGLPEQRGETEKAGPRAVAHPEALEKQIGAGEEVDEQPVVVDEAVRGEVEEEEDAGLVLALLDPAPVRGDEDVVYPLLC